MPLILTIIAIVFLYQVIFNFKRIMKKLNDHDLKQIRKIEVSFADASSSVEEIEKELKERSKCLK